MTCLKLQTSKWRIQASNLDRLLQSLACNQQTKLVLLKLGCQEEQRQPGNSLETQIPESETLGVELSVCVWIGVSWFKLFKP